MEHFHYKIPGWFTFPGLYSEAVDRYDNAHFVEVGSFQGASAAFMAVEIINSGKNIKFDCVDIWGRFAIDGLNLKEPEKAPDDLVYQLFLKNIEPVKDYINVIQNYSVKAAWTYKDNSLDFVFIDADHAFEAVTDDLSAWYPKVKRGGTIAGHDYFTDKPVEFAVNKFFHFDIQRLRCSQKQNCWVYVKS